MKRGTVGFTLIELVIIIFVVSIAIGTLLTTLAAVTRDTIRPLVMQTATQLTEQELEKITGNRFSFACSCNNNAYAAPFAGYSRQITVSSTGLDAPAMSQYKRVDIVVTNSTIGSVTLRTIVTNRDSVVGCGSPPIGCT